jgi:hypothetical protein
VIQQPLRLLCRLDAPAVVPPQVIAGITSFRNAVQTCWALRHDRAEGAQSACARHIGAQVSHMSAYLADECEDGGSKCPRRDMPAKFVIAFEAWCGNTAVTQWMAANAKLTVVEEIQAMNLNAAAAPAVPGLSQIQQVQAPAAAPLTAPAPIAPPRHSTPNRGPRHMRAAA